MKTLDARLCSWWGIARLGSIWEERKAECQIEPRYESANDGGRGLCTHDLAVDDVG